MGLISQTNYMPGFLQEFQQCYNKLKKWTTWNLYDLSTLVLNYKEKEKVKVSWFEKPNQTADKAFFQRLGMAKWCSILEYNC